MMQVNSQERENIETTILALVLSQKRGCSLPQLCKEYYDLEGERIPWKRLGHSSLMKFLQSMSKTIEIENRNNETFLHGIPSDKSKHVSKLIAGQKDQKPILGRKVYKPSHYYPNTAPFKVRIPAEILNMTIDFVNKYPNGVNKDYIFQTVQAQMPYVDITMSEMEEQLQMLSHKIHMYNNKIFPILNNSETSQLRSPIVTASGNEDLDNMYEYEDNEENDFKFISSTSISTSSPKSLAKTKTTSCFIKETISKCQNQNVKDEFNILTEKAEINEDNVYNLNHCNDNIEILTECNNNNNNNSDIDNENYDSKHTENLINDRIKFRLEKLIQNNPNGIRCAELPEKYLEEYKVCLNYTELGFSSVREFASQLPEIFHCVQSEDIGDFMLYFAKRDVPSNNSKEKHTTMSLAQLHEIYLPHEEDEALPTTLSIDTCNQLIPDGIVTIGESVGHLNVIDLVSDEKPYVEVVIAEVFTPAFFWIQLRKKQRTFKTFMDELHNFYVTKHQDYVVPPVILEKGLNCACVYNGVWHRGIIKSVKPDLQVTVMFYDYGTLKTYPPNAVCYLHRMFSLLPAQAIPCGLFNTRPYKSSKWTRNATHQFAVRTSNIPLIATVASMNEEDNSMMVTLTDTLEEEDVHINDWLVEQKLAEHGKMVCIKLRNFPFLYYLQCQERRKQKSRTPKTFQSDKLVKPTECTKLTRAAGSSQKKVELYDSTINSRSSSGNNFGIVTDNKISSTSYQKGKEILQYLKNKRFIKGAGSSGLNLKGKQPRNLIPLYEQLMNFKRNSKPYNSNYTEHNDGVKSNDLSNSKSILSKQMKQTLRESLNNIIKHDDNEYDDTSASSQSSCGRNVYEQSNKKDDILRNYTYIPKEYANHFHIQNSEDESDMTCTETSSDMSNEFKHVDWSAISKDMEQRKGHISQQDVVEKTYKSISEKRDNIPLAESYFLRAVRGSVHFTERDEDVRWLPTGNINQTEDPSPLVLRNIQKQAASNRKEKIVAISKKMLNILTEGRSAEFLEPSTVISKSTNETQFIESAENNNDLIRNNALYSNGGDKLCDTDFQMNSNNGTSQLENYYIHMKSCTLASKLLHLWSMKQRELNQSVSLDSDDLTASCTSVSSQESFNNNDRESETRENEIILNEAHARLNASDISNSVDAENVDINNLRLYECKSGDDKPHEEPFASTDRPTTSDLSEELVPIESVVMEEVSLPQKSIQVEKLAKESEQIEGSLSTKETIVTEELVSINEALSADAITAKSTVPVFNDIDIESDTEEWDVYMPTENLHRLLKIDSPFAKDIENTLDTKINSCLTIEEVNDMDSVQNTDRIDRHKEQENYKELDKIECSNAKFKNLKNGQNEVTTTCFKNNVESNGKEDSILENSVSTYSELRGKSRTLKEMLNKAKLKQRN